MGSFKLEIKPNAKQWGDLTKDLASMAKKAPASVGIAVFETLGEKTFKTSQGLVPYDTGALKSTGLLDPPRKANGYSTTVSYGSIEASVPNRHGKTSILYAVRVHQEPLNYKNNRTFLYLQRAAENALNTITKQKIQERFKEILKSKGLQNPTRLKQKRGTATMGE